MFRHLKRSGRGFSYREFSRRAGFSSPNYLKLVSDGMRNLAPASIDKFADGLGLTEAERPIFRALVLLAEAKTDQERSEQFDRLRSLVPRTAAIALSEQQLEVYSAWYPLVVREMMNLPGFVGDSGWVARRLRPKIRNGEAGQALRLLVRLGLATKDSDGNFAATDKVVSTGPQVHSLAVRNFHRSHLALAADAIDRVPVDERNITSVTIPLSRAKYEVVREEIAALRQRLLELAHEETDDEVEVHHVLFSLYPVTKASRRASSDKNR